MATTADFEAADLRRAIRELVAFSAMPAAWVGREPAAIAGGLADVLVGSLNLEFVFVRLCDPNAGVSIDATRGRAPDPFPEWLRTQLNDGRFSHTEITAGFGGGQPCRGVAIPIGVNAEAGLVAVASNRRDFPTEIDQLLLSVAANHAAAAFQNARLREELAVKSADEVVGAHERFRDLVNSVDGIVWEADVPSFEVSFVSQQAERILGYPTAQWLSEPTFWIDHLHPDDRDWAVEYCLRATREHRDHDFEYRMAAADGRVVWMRNLVTIVVQSGR